MQATVFPQLALTGWRGITAVVHVTRRAAYRDPLACSHLIVRVQGAQTCADICMPICATAADEEDKQHVYRRVPKSRPPSSSVRIHRTSEPSHKPTRNKHKPWSESHRAVRIISQLSVNTFVHLAGTLRSGASDRCRALLPSIWVEATSMGDGRGETRHGLWVGRVCIGRGARRSGGRGKVQSQQGRPGIVASA